MITPTQDYRRTEFKRPAKPCQGIDATVNRVIGRYERRSGKLAELRRDAEKVEALAEEMKPLSDHALHERLMGFREEFRRAGRSVAQCLIPALAAIREAAERQVRLRPFPVQLMGALALHRGYLAEMATGEGKTLTAALAAVLAGWTRQPCHIVTVNDYLVQRDAEWLRALYHFCGVRVGYVTAPMKPEERRKGYNADVTYATSKELLADFLRDRLRLGMLQDPTRRLIRRMLVPQLFAQGDGVVLRGLHTAIIDEADSVLIDEAVTPLIISAPHDNKSLEEVVKVASDLVTPLQPGVHYTIERRYKEIEFTKEGLDLLAGSSSNLSGIWRGTERRNELVKQALVAREFFLPGKQYIIDKEKVVIVDEFTGRQMAQRSWRQGLHQAVEAKEGLPISAPTETVARMSFQRFFRLFHRLSGMTGTAREAAAEFWQTYQLPVVVIPTNKPCIREQLPDRVFADESSKWQAVVAEIERIHATSRPILVGTRSVEASQKLADLLKERGLEFKLLNAVHHAEEAETIAVAGYARRITIATNMAGRGTDIKLGDGVAAMGGLHVIATERHESGRVDRQLFGRAARQGDPGSAQSFVSIEDELLQRYLPGRAHREVSRLIRSGLLPKGRLVMTAAALAQRNAQNLAVKQRRNVLRMDDWMENALPFSGPEVI